jgi:ZipA, C-terminal FtsZ-binding domain
MNSLQTGLIAVGVLVVSLLAIWSWWQTRSGKNEAKSLDALRVPETKKTSPATETNHQLRVEPDEFRVRMDDEDVVGEPVVRAASGVASDIVATNDFDLPTTRGVPFVESVKTITPTTVEVQSSVAETTDQFSSSQPLTSSPHEAPVLAAASVPGAPIDVLPFDERLHVHAVIFHDDGQPTDVAPFLHLAGGNACFTRLFRQSPWEAVDLSQPTGAAHKVCLAVPIASRSGSVTEAEFDDWRTQVAVAAAKQNCIVEFEGFTAVEKRSAELDEFLVAVDCVPIVYLVRKDGASWSGTRLRGTLEANGFRLQTDGRFAYHEVGTQDIIFYAVDGYERAFTPEQLRTDAVVAFRLVMEVALLKQPLHRFDIYRQTLRALSKLLDADLRDSTGANVGEAEFAEMREQVKTSADALTDAGIVPGSVTAQTLFG